MSCGDLYVNPYYLTKKLKARIEALENAQGTNSSNFCMKFTIVDWVLSAGSYQLLVNHGLESQKINIELLENGSTPVRADRVEIIDNNNIRLYVVVDPDCRFAGTLIIDT